MLMKRNYFLFAITMLIATTGCQKNLHDNQSEHDRIGEESGLKNIVVDCTPIVLSGTISSNTTLLTGKTYLLDGIVDVKNATLTIQPGTLILGKSSVSSALVIDRTAQINAVGTATNPIVFTSDKAPGSRAAGDWLGVYIMGNAPNNQSNALAFSIEGNSYTAGGNSLSSSAGSLQYVQVHFAGKPSSTGDELSKSALSLASVGSGMTIRNIQITNSLNDGLTLWGGSAGVKEIFAFKSHRWDFAVSQGYRGNMQSLFGFKDNVSTTFPNSTSMYITNNLRGADNAPYTYPVVSNLTLLGGTYCSGSDADFNRGVTIGLNGSARIYNSVIESFNQYGLFLADANIVSKTKTGTDQLIYSYNSSHDITANPYFAQIAPLTWAGAEGCRFNASGTMQNWIEGTAGVACQQAGNQFSLLSTGYYKNSMCGYKCSNFPNLYIDAATTDLEDPEYSVLGGFFDHPQYRGALQSSANTWLKNSWVDFCMLTRNYCE
jgi:hypothetical protein